MSHAPSAFSGALYTYYLTNFCKPYTAIHVRRSLWL